MPETITTPPPPPAATTEAAPAATPTPQTPPPEPQPAETQKKDGADVARTALMSDDNFWGKILGPREEPKPEGDEPKDEPKDTDEPKPKTEPAKPEKPEKPKKAAAKVDESPPEPKKVIKRSDPADLDRIVTSATTAATKAALASMPKPEPAAPAANPDDNAALLERLDEDAREDANELIEMERLNPRKYTGLLKKFVTYKSKEADLIKKWQKANPGQAFNREDEAHDEFYAENEPEISDVDRRKAQREIVRREARQEVESVVAPIKQRAESEERIRQIEPAIRNVQMNALGYMLTVVKPEAKDVLSEEGGYVKLQESDPEAVEITEAEFRNVQPLLIETVKIYANAVRPDPSNNPIHKAFIEAVVEAENTISQQPLKEQIREDGTAFARLADFVKMTPAEQKQHWTVQQNEVLGQIASSAADRASQQHKKEAEKYEKWAERRGYKPNPASKTTPAKKVEPAAKASNGAPATPAPASPSGSGRIQVDTNATKPVEEDGGFRKWFGTGTRPR